MTGYRKANSHFGPSSTVGQTIDVDSNIRFVCAVGLKTHFSGHVGFISD